MAWKFNPFTGGLVPTGSGGAGTIPTIPTTITATAEVVFGPSAGGDVTHVLPATPAIGDRAKYYVLPSGGNRSLDLDPEILRPSDSAVSFPKTLTSGKHYIVLFERGPSAWWLVSLVGGY
jgi:hypothetical protein